MPDYVLVGLMVAALMMPSLVAGVAWVHNHEVVVADSPKWWHVLIYAIAWLLAFGAYGVAGTYASMVPSEDAYGVVDPYWADFLIAMYWIVGVALSVIVLGMVASAIHDSRKPAKAEQPKEEPEEHAA